MEIKIDIPKFLDEALTPVAKECGERLSDIVNLVFTPVIIARAMRDKHLKMFLDELNNEVNKIPEENIQSPAINIVGTVLEDVLKYYCDDDVIRKMFVKLIASSMNKNCNIHPAFGEIIKQISRYELSILNYICFKNNEIQGNKYHVTPYHFFYEVEEDWLHALYFIVYFGDESKPTVLSSDEVVISLLNLQRLSLIHIKDLKGICDSMYIDVKGLKVEREDGRKQKYTSIEVMGTYFLENFMNTCYSKELDKYINTDLILEWCINEMSIFSSRSPNI